MTIQALTETVQRAAAWVRPLESEIGARHRRPARDWSSGCWSALLGDGHVLLEGVPGLAKTLSLKTLAGVDRRHASSASSSRPTCCPADIVGTLIYNPQDGSFLTKHGPIFANLVLADEINRAPAKVQSALLEAMQERQVTIGEQTYPLPEPVPRAGDAEPDRAGGHLSAARGAGRPLHAQGRRRLSEPRRRSGRSST